MLKFLVLPFALSLLALILAVLFAPKSQAVRQELARAVQPEPRSSSLGWFLVGLAALAVLPLPFLFRTADSEIFTIIGYTYPAYLILLVLIGCGVLLVSVAIGLFREGLPLALDIGAKLTSTERRSLWRRTLRACRKFRQW